MVQANGTEIGQTTNHPTININENEEKTKQ